MRLGETLSVTLFGESHGHLVGALLEGVPAGLPIDDERIAQRMSTRRPGGHFASKRKKMMLLICSQVFTMDLLQVNPF